MAARRPAHKVGHPQCPHGATSWAECDDRAREAYGRCTALTEKGDECRHWATEEVEERRYCAQHAASVFNAAFMAAKTAEKVALLDERITAYIEHTLTHPSIWGPRLQQPQKQLGDHNSERDGSNQSQEAADTTVHSITSSRGEVVGSVDGGGGESNPSLPEVPMPSTQSVSVGAGGPAEPRTPVEWSASSGLPPTRRRASAPSGAPTRR